jgi:hypothetical protein
MRRPWAPALFQQGIIPVLTRLVVERHGGPFGVDPDMHARGAFDFTHVKAAAGGVDRIHLNMWLEVSAPLGVVYGAPPARAGEVVKAGEVFAEHTLTRPFAAPGERRVTRLEVDGLDPIPGAAIERVAPPSVATPPPDGRLLDVDPQPDAAPIVFGLSHTDSNQHVNSIVYLRLFEEAALRRLQAHGVSATLLARRAALAYVKPSFAGNVTRVHLRAYEHDGAFGAVGCFVPDGQPLDKATCWVHVGF